MTAGPAVRKVVVAVHGPVRPRIPAVDGLTAWSVHRPHPDEPSARPDGIGGVVMAWIAGDEVARFIDRPAGWRMIAQETWRRT